MSRRPDRWRRRSGRSGGDGRARLLWLVSGLLRYPERELLAETADLRRTVAELPGGPGRRWLTEFADWYLNSDPMTLARHYVEVFDLSRDSSLYLTYYLHGDTRARGMALLGLKHCYRVAGLIPPDDELPDYLPLVCEFAALIGPSAGEVPLRRHRAGIELIRTALHDAGSPYVAPLEALCATLPTGLPSTGLPSTCLPDAGLPITELPNSGPLSIDDRTGAC